MFTLISQSTVEPITLAEAKAHLRQPSTADDTLISELLAAARNTAEIYTGRDLVQRVYDYSLTGFPSGDIELEKAPVNAVTSINYVDTNGDDQTVAPAVYGANLNETAPFVYLNYGQSWPSARQQQGAVTIRLTTGYPSGTGSPIDEAENIPAAIKSAIKVMLRDLYDNRGNTEHGVMGMTAQNLLAPFRIWKL